MPRPQMIRQALNFRRRKTTSKHINKIPIKPKQQNTTNKTTLYLKKTLTHPLTKRPKRSRKIPLSPTLQFFGNLFFFSYYSAGSFRSHI